MSRRNHLSKIEHITVSRVHQVKGKGERSGHSLTIRREFWGESIKREQLMTLKSITQEENEMTQ
jgi:hypothetical protein